MKIIIAIPIIFAIVFMFLFVMAYYLAMLFKRSRNAEYQESIIYLGNFIEHNEVGRKNFDYIMVEFDKLLLNNQDRERTKKLFVKFCFKYKTIWHEILESEVETKNIE